MPSLRRRRPAAGLAAVFATAAVAAGVVTSAPLAHAATLLPVASAGGEELHTNAAAHHYYNDPYRRGSSCRWVRGVYRCSQTYGNQKSYGNQRSYGNQAVPDRAVSSGSGGRDDPAVPYEQSSYSALTNSPANDNQNQRWSSNDGDPMTDSADDDQRWAGNDGDPMTDSADDDQRWAGNDGVPDEVAEEDSVSSIPQAAPASSPASAGASPGKSASCFTNAVWDDFVARSDAVLADYGVSATGRSYFGDHVASMTRRYTDPDLSCLTGHHPYRSMGSWAAVARFVDGGQAESVYTDTVEDLSKRDGDFSDSDSDDDDFRGVERAAAAVTKPVTTAFRRTRRRRRSSISCESRALSCESSGWTYGCTSRASCCCPQYCDSYFASVFAPLDIAGSAVRRSVGGCCAKSFCVG